MESAVNKIKVKGKQHYSFDSFCDDIAGYFERYVEKGIRYDGLYLYSSDGLDQEGLNKFREGIVRRLNEQTVNDYSVIATPCLPRDINLYQDTHPERGGWFFVDVGYFLSNGTLVL